MFLISKMIYDPRPRNTLRGQKVVMPNRMGRTIGFVLHTPKFFNCKRYDFYVSQFDEMTYRMGEDLSEETMERRYLAKLAHAKCRTRFNRRHLSYRGYVYFIGPKRRYQFHYMGNINPHNPNLNRWGYIQKHDLYTRWFDNGPQNDPKTELSAEDIKLLGRHMDDFSAMMRRSQATMEEYARMRSADGGRKP